jgi:predicted nucleic acid-binding protein
MALVVDTDVVSFLFKRDTRATLYAPHLLLDVPLVTNNESHFSHVPGLTVISEKTP